MRREATVERVARAPAIEPDVARLPRFSLIVATVDRIHPLQGLLSSLVAQDYPNLEVLIADQNDGDLLTPVVRSFESRLDIVWLRTARGLSRARNAALRRASGDIIGFPDDDCIYPLGLLHGLARAFFSNATVDGICVPPVDERTGRRYRGFRSGRTALTSRNTW